METKSLRDAVNTFTAYLVDERNSGIHATKPVLFDLLVEVSKPLNKLNEYLTVVEEEKLRTQFREFCLSQFTEFKTTYQELFDCTLGICTGGEFPSSITAELISNAANDVKFLMSLFNNYESKYGNSLPEHIEYPSLEDVRTINDKISYIMCRNIEFDNDADKTPKHDFDLSEIEFNVESFENMGGRLGKMTQYNIVVPDTYSKEQLKTIVDTLLPTDI